MNPLIILLSAAFTGATSLSLGLLTAGSLRLRLYRGELFPLSYLLGSAALSLIVFLSLTAHLAHAWWFAVVGCASIGMCLRKRPWKMSAGAAPERLSRWWRLLFGLVLLVYGVLTFVYAWAPETSPDGVAYHLSTVARYLRQGGFEIYTRNMYSSLPMGVEMLFVFAFAFGRHSAAALVHWQFLLTLPFLMLACGRRFGSPRAGAAAGLLVFVSPVFALDGSTAYVDVATGTVVFGLFFVLLLWEREPSPGLLIVSGLLAGFCYACKMTAAPAVPFALGFVIWRLWRMRRLSWMPVLVVAGCALLLIAPWLIKNVVMVGNPFSPFLNRYFPNPHVRISFEEEYRKDYQTYSGAIRSPAQIPPEVTVRGGALNGLLGPVFLLSPLALLALRWPLGRRAWVAALLFATTYPGNIGTRFLLSSAPLVAMALGLVLSRWQGMATAVVLFHAFLSWPKVIPVYSDPYAWRIDEFRLNQALRKDPEDNFLTRSLAEYKMAKLADENVPPDARIFTFGGITEAYTSRDVTVAYQAGLNNAAGEILATGVAGDMVEGQAFEFRFPSRRVRRLRLVQTATTPQIWSVSELHLLAPDGSEVPRRQSWRLRAMPNPWDVQWAFDNCPVTRWKAWQASRPGEYLEVEFDTPVEVGGVRAGMSADQPAVRLRVDVETDQGWSTIPGEPSVTPIAPPRNVRRTATDDLKRLGFTHLVVYRKEFLADDIARNTAAWGLRLLADSGHSKLYRIE